MTSQELLQREAEGVVDTATRANPGGFGLDPLSLITIAISAIQALFQAFQACKNPPAPTPTTGKTKPKEAVPSDTPVFADDGLGLPDQSQSIQSFLQNRYRHGRYRGRLLPHVTEAVLKSASEQGKELSYAEAQELAHATLERGRTMPPASLDDMATASTSS